MPRFFLFWPIMSINSKKAHFSKKLLKWFTTNHRPMPWKEVKNPYHIWLSEIILQQTRVAQGLPYYEHFVEKYPTVFELANAREDEVMKSWEGLGYYSRARNLHATAKQIAFEKGGEFPNTYEEIKALKGIGPYTAAAIASFAFDLPYAVLDGNVYRVFSRCFGIKTPIDATAGKKEFTLLADDLLNKKYPADYNQALMDFGATHCTPKKPKCESCPFQKDCSAYQSNRISEYPVKSKKITIRHRYFNYLVIRSANDLILNKRTSKDIWTNLYEFPMIETDVLLEKEEIEQQASEAGLLPDSAKFVKSSKPLKQTLTHQRINARFWEYKVDPSGFYKKSAFIFVQEDKLTKFAFPKIIDWYLKDKSLYLELF
ncbi:MAG: A/G-specific adenine glycosylase [Saprospiraceae bacterium]|jgi:A/G-specific adenine glycosylase